MLIGLKCKNGLLRNLILKISVAINMSNTHFLIRFFVTKIKR